MSITLAEAIKMTNEYTERRLKDIKEYGDKTKQRIENTFLFLQEVGGVTHKFADEIRYYWAAESPVFRMKADAESHPLWNLIHSVVGELENAGSEAVGDGRSRLVKVMLRPKDERFNHITFTYEKKLPKNAKCKIKTVVHKSKVMVCEE